MSRIDRLKGYARPLREGNWQGAGRDQANIDRWSDRAADNSKIAPRASEGPMELPSTGKRQELRDTASAPKVSRNADAMMKAKADANTAGSSPYLRGIRRDA